MPHLEAGQIRFRPVTKSDLSLLETWLNLPHFRQWWGDPKSELESIEKMVSGEDKTRPFIILVNGEPFGYIQHWSVKDNLDPLTLQKYAWLEKVSRDATGVDISIADAHNLSRGYGSAILREFIGHLQDSGHRYIVIDPHAGNDRAIKAYQKAGFSIIPELAGTTGETIIMQQELPQETH